MISADTAHTDFRPSDRYRIQLLLEEKYGCHALGNSRSFKHITHLSLPHKGIFAIDLDMFEGHLISLDLSKNLLSNIENLEKQKKLQHLNVSGNNSDDLIDSIRPQIENL